MDTLRCEFEVLSPLYLGGADALAELRPPSLKGLIRFWYRALDPDFKVHEAGFFGGIAGGAGQCPFLLRLRSLDPKDHRMSMERRDIERKFSQGQGKDARNGLLYLGFPLFMRPNDTRNALPPGHRFHVDCVFPNGSTDRLRRAVAASLWCLGHLGGAGTRSRRGFGSLALRSWSVEKPWDELTQLPLLCREKTLDAWYQRFDEALAAIEGWFGGAEQFQQRRAQHPHLGALFTWLLLPDGFPKTAWDKALNEAGRRLQDFRLRRQPDYNDVKEHVRAMSRQGGKRLTHAPARSAFGLPLTFRFSSLLQSRPVTFVPHGSERHGSLVLLRLAALGERVFPLFLRLDGALPGANPLAADRDGGLPLGAAAGGAALLDEFFSSLSAPRRS